MSVTCLALLFWSLCFRGSVIRQLKGQSCGRSYFYTENSGILLSPNYPSVYSVSCVCIYTISLASSSSTLLTFETFELDRNTSTGDHVRISCTSNASYIQTTYYWNSVAAPISVPWCSSVRLYFQSDSVNSYSVRGFKIQYQVSTEGCGNTVYTKPSGDITSPNYPQPYNNNENCTYSIWTSQPSSFILTFQSFALPYDSSCAIDWVQVWCAGTGNMSKYCGLTAPMPISIRNCNQVLIWFRTDGSVAYSGFSLQYVVSPKDSTASASIETITESTNLDSTASTSKATLTVSTNPDSAVLASTPMTTTSKKPVHTSSATTHVRGTSTKGVHPSSVTTNLIGTSTKRVHTSPATTNIMGTSTKHGFSEEFVTAILCTTHTLNDVAVLVPTVLLMICVLGYIALALYHIINRFRVRTNSSQDDLQHSSENGDFPDSRTVSLYANVPRVGSPLVHENIPIQDLHSPSSKKTMNNDSHIYEHLRK